MDTIDILKNHKKKLKRNTMLKGLEFLGPMLKENKQNLVILILL